MSARRSPSDRPVTKAPSTHKATIELGEAVVGNKLMWASATLITGADPQSEGGCLRRTWYERVGGKERVTTAAMTAGSGMHAEIEHYLAFGVAALSPTVMAGRGFIPEPGPRLTVEASIAKAGLTACGVPVAGHIDLLNTREEYLDATGELRSDPKNTVEVIDWKSTSDIKWAKTAEQVAATIQMNTYGAAVLTKLPDTEHVRLTHVYFQRGARPKALLSTSLRTREQIAGRWKYAESIVRTIIDAIKESDVNKVDGNNKACKSYNQACPHTSYCSVGNHNSLDDLYSKIAKDYQQKVDTKMGLLSGLNMPPIPLAPNQAQLPAPTPDFAQPPDIRQQLADEEQRLRAQQVQVQQMPSAAPMSLKVVWDRLQTHGRGMPALGGAAAQALAAACGIGLGVGAGLAGTGQLGTLMLLDPAHIYQLAAELEAQAQSNPAPMALPSAQEPVQIVTPPQYAPAAPVPSVQSGGLLPPDAPASNPAFASAGPPPVAAPTMPTTEPVAAAPKKRGRPKSATSDTAPLAPVAPPLSGGTQAAPTPPAAVSPFIPTAAATSGDLEVYINCRPSHPTVSLHPYIDRINAELSRRYCVGANGQPTIQDIRVAPKDSPLGYGAWEGVLHEIVRTSPPPNAAYHLDIGTSKLLETVADAMLVVCNAREALFVKGVI